MTDLIGALNVSVSAADFRNANKILRKEGFTTMGRRGFIPNFCVIGADARSEESLKGKHQSPEILKDKRSVLRGIDQKQGMILSVISCFLLILIVETESGPFPNRDDFQHIQQMSCCGLRSDEAELLVSFDEIDFTYKCTVCSI